MIKKILTFIIFIGILVCVCIGSYLIYQNYNDYKINQQAIHFLEDFDKKIVVNKSVVEESQELVIEKEEVIENIDRNENIFDYKGYNVRGKIEIPKTGIKYPIFDVMNDSNALEVSLCIQYFSNGADLNFPGNTVIIGHNYRSGLFFGDNDKLDINDSVYITDVKTGNRIEYKIYEKFYTPEEDTSFYNRNTEGKREVSLITCKKNDNSYRLVLLAREI